MKTPVRFIKFVIKNNGLDLSTYLLSYFQPYTAPKTIASSVSNTLSSKFIYKDKSQSSSFSYDGEQIVMIPLPLVNKNRCIVEDYMKLP